MALRYDLDHFDRHHCLRPPLALIGCVAFLCRDFLLPIADAATKLGGGGGLDLHWVYGLRQPYWYLLQLPALLVLYAWIRRTPGGDAVARWAWRNARWLLIASAVAQLYPFARELGPPIELHLDGRSVVAVLCVASAAFVATSRRFRDACAEFPARPG